jgi:hypothetical protein
VITCGQRRHRNRRDDSLLDQRHRCGMIRSMFDHRFRGWNIFFSMKKIRHVPPLPQEFLEQDNFYISSNGYFIEKQKLWFIV